MMLPRLLLTAAIVSAIFGASARAAYHAPRHSQPGGSRSGFLTPDAARGNVPVLFVSDTATNAVWLFDARNFNKPPIGELTEGMDYPSALSLDGRNNLYVLNHDADAIDVFPSGATQYNRRISLRNGTLDGLGVAADGTLATLAVRGGLTKTALWIFDKGSLKPTRVIRIPLGKKNIEFANASVAIDYSDDVYLAVTRYPDGPDQVLEVTPGSRVPIVTSLPVGLAMAFDRAGNLYLGESNGSTGSISVYPPDTERPSYIITSGINLPGDFCALPNGRLYVPNGVFEANGDILRFAPGATNGTVILQGNDVTRPQGTAYRAAER